MEWTISPWTLQNIPQQATWHVSIHSHVQSSTPSLFGGRIIGQGVVPRHLGHPPQLIAHLIEQVARHHQVHDKRPEDDEEEDPADAAKGQHHAQAQLRPEQLVQWASVSVLG